MILWFDFDVPANRCDWRGDAENFLDRKSATLQSFYTFLSAFSPADRAELRAAIDGANPSQDGFIRQCTLEQSAVGSKTVLLFWRAKFDGTGALSRVSGGLADIADIAQSGLDIMSRAQLESQVAEKNRMLEAIVDSAVNAILTIDESAVIRTANRATTKLFGYASEELIGRNVRMLMPSPYFEEHDQYIANYVQTGRKKIIGIGREVTGKRRDGSTFPLHLAVTEFIDEGKRFFNGIITDLTDREAAEAAVRESQARLAQAQKMEAIGQLTGGIAHDFNNLLTVITGNLELLEMRMEDEMSRDLVRRADDAARMGARLTERLLTFSRRRSLQPSTINLNDVTLGMLELLRRALGETIAVNANLAPNLWSAKIDASEIENAILNLAINSRDAMPDGGEILIETGNFSLMAPGDAVFPDLRPGDYVKLSVSDTGSGMPPEVVARVFEPFFTTKEPGRGTGLGLSTIYGFARQSGGDARVYSEPGKGTVVSLYLPRDMSRSENQTGPAAVPKTAISSETILVVEDSLQVRELTVRRLAALGYETLVAENGSQAIALLRENSEVDLVFSDMVMPGGISGLDVAAWIKENRPSIKILLTSGFAPELIEGSGEIDLLKKPYTQADLSRAVRRALYS